MTNTRECGPMCNPVVGVIFAAICWLELMIIPVMSFDKLFLINPQNYVTLSIQKIIFSF